MAFHALCLSSAPGRSVAQVLQLVPGPPPLLLLSPVKAGALGLQAPPEVFHLDGLDDVLQPGQDEDLAALLPPAVVQSRPAGREVCWAFDTLYVVVHAEVPPSFTPPPLKLHTQYCVL